MLSQAQDEIINEILKIREILMRQELMISAYRHFAKRDEERIAALEAELARRPPCQTPLLPTTT